MKSYIWLSFAFMGWVFYEMSGGSSFAPPQPSPQTPLQTQAAERVAENQAATVQPDNVARADTSTLLPVSSPTPQTATIQPAHLESEMPEPVSTQHAQAEVEAPAFVSLAAPSSPAEPAVLAGPQPDLRAVGGARVNMRSGPGTGFGVITTLSSGTPLEVIDTNASGWAKVRTIERGLEGWMAERLLTAPQT